MTTNFTLLHISDLHITTETKSLVRKVLLATAERVNKETLVLDYVVVSGDIAYSGSEADYNLATGLISEVAELLGVPLDRFVIVPGNHDVERSAIDRYHEIGLRADLQSLDAADALWRSEKDRGNALARQRRFREFTSQLGCKTDAFVIKKGEITVGFAPVNTAWRASSDLDRGALFITTEQLDSTLEAIAAADIRVVVMHHPPEWLHESEESRVRAQFNTAFHIVCSGHTHTLESHRQVSPIGETYFSTAKAISDKKYALGATVLCVDGESRRLRAIHWNFSRRTEQMSRDTELAENGEHVVTLGPAKQSALSRAPGRAALVRHSENLKSQLERRVQALAPQVTSRAGIDIVEPSIRMRGGKGLVVRTGDVVEDPDSWLFHGQALVGRTTLLLYLHKRIAAAGGQACYFQFGDLPAEDKGDVRGALRKRLSLSHSISDDLFSRKVTLLIDDIDVNDQVRMENLQRFLSEHSSVRVVGAIARTALGTPAKMPATVEAIVGRWKNADLYPSSFSTIQTIAKTLQEKGVFKADSERVSKLISALFDGELPRLPWAVLMFFEICIEGDELAHTNVAALVQRYLSVQTARAGEAGRSLSGVTARAMESIARQMFAARSIELPVADVKETLRSDYSESALKIEPAEVLNHLAAASIVESDSESVRFTFPVLMDFAYARHLTSTGTIGELTTEKLRRESGALAFASSLKANDDLCRSAFRLVREPVTVKKSLDSEQLDGLTVPADDLVEAFDRAPISIDEVGSAYEEAESRRQGQRRSQIEGTAEPVIGGIVLDAFVSALGILRNGTFLSAATKRDCVNEAVDLTITLTNELCRLKKEVYQVLVQHFGYPETRDDVEMAMFMVIIGNGVLATHGGGDHLVQTLEEALAAETDQFRIVTLIIWLFHVGGRLTGQSIAPFLAKLHKKEALAVLHFSLLLSYVNSSALEGRPDQRARGLVRAVTHRSNEIEAGGRTPRGAVDDATNNQMRRIDAIATAAMKPLKENPS